MVSPEPWASWDEVCQARQALTTARYLLLRRSDHLSAEEQAHIDAVSDTLRSGWPTSAQ